MSSAWGNVFATGPNRNVYAVDLFSNLRALTPPTGSASIEVDGGITVGDGLGGIFFFSAGSALADDGLNVIAPNVGTGRWIRSTQVGFNLFRKNAIINGGMEIAQRNTNFAAIATGAYNIDRWFYAKNGTMVHTLSQDNDVPTVAQAGQLFINSMRFNLTTPQAVIGAGDYSLIEQRIEGYNWRALAQRVCTLSFWVKATLIGTYSVSFANSGDNAVITNDFTINIANTWEKKIITFPASPAAGAWNYTNGIGIKFTINLAVGSNFTQIPGIWNVNNLFGSTNQINGVQAGATDFRITGVQLEAGSLNSEFERRSIQEELLLCQRYYEKSWPQGVPVFTAASIGYDMLISSINVPDGSFVGSGLFKQLKRTGNAIITVCPFTVPTNTNRISNISGADLAANSGVPVNTNDRNFAIRNSSGGNINPSANAFIFHWIADAEL